MRLRDAAITYEDYELWKTHEVDVLHESVPGSASPCSWKGGEALHREALVLVPDNAAAGKSQRKTIGRQSTFAWRSTPCKCRGNCCQDRGTAQRPSRLAQNC